MGTTLEDRTRASLLLDAGDPRNQERRAEFVDRYAPVIRGWCQRRGLQPADQEDVAQTVLCRLFQVLPTFEYDPRRRFRGLLYRAVSRAVADIFRERARRPGGRGSGDTRVQGRLDAEPAPDDPDVEDLVRGLGEQIEFDQRVRAACARVRGRVEPHTWQAFWLTVVEGMGGAEAAERLGMRRAAVPVAKHRVLKLIRRELGDDAGPGAAGAAPEGEE
jgi:RNA polymerase sigma-70 factor (ECF subfamily)